MKCHIATCNLREEVWQAHSDTQRECLTFEQSKQSAVDTRTARAIVRFADACDPQC
jgi:hypothetical protein